MLNKYEIVFTHSDSVSCDGKNPPFDHPKVFLHLDPKTQSVICPYCSMKFMYKEKENDAPQDN